MDTNGQGLVISHVRKAFRRLVAVDDLTFEVPRGSMFGLLGANGAGKTTTLRMILNILSPDQGVITWQGKRVAELPRSTFGYLPEERGLYSKMKTGEQLVFLAGLNNLTPSEATKHWEWGGYYVSCDSRTLRNAIPKLPYTNSRHLH